MADLVQVRLNSKYRHYNAGETPWFDPEEARTIIEVERVGEKIEKEKAPAAAGGKV